jgi:hypothetical protein
MLLLPGALANDIPHKAVKMMGPKAEKIISQVIDRQRIFFLLV